jgi:glycosyltransferase involved in cell wall biosynthesis
LKICIVTWAPFVAGAEVAAERLAVGLQSVGHEVLIVVGTNGDAFERFVAAGIRCQFVAQKFTSKLGWLSYWKSRNQLIRILEREKPDLLHSNDLPTHQMASDAAKKVGIPRICHHRWIFKRQAIDWLNKFSAERHLFVSNALMQMLCSESPSLNASPKQVVYDGLPIPEMPTDEDRVAAKIELAIARDKTTVLFAGQLIERKGVADLLHAWSLLPIEVRDKAELLIVGDDLEGKGQYRTEMEQLSEKLGLAAKFMGFQKNVPRWLTASDIVMVPSHAEPLGNATLEAMAHGRPVIATLVGGIPEMVDSEKTGLLVQHMNPPELAGALVRLISNPNERRQFGMNARKQCEIRFSLKTHIENTLEQYEVVLSQRRKNNP